MISLLFSVHLLSARWSDPSSVAPPEVSSIIYILLFCHVKRLFFLNMASFSSLKSRNPVAEMFPRSRRSSLGDDGRKGDDTQQETRVGL